MISERRRSSRFGGADGFGAPRASCARRSSGMATVNSRSIAHLRAASSVLLPLDAVVVCDGPYIEITQLQTIRFVNATGNNALDHIDLKAIARDLSTVQNLGLHARHDRLQMNE